jgi:hypothetical protein
VPDRPAAGLAVRPLEREVDPAHDVARLRRGRSLEGQARVHDELLALRRGGRREEGQERAGDSGRPH